MVVYSDIFQLTGPQVRVSTRLAGYGFVVATPEIYHRIEPAGTALPFDDAGAMWGFDFVWPEVIGRHGLAMGIVDALPVDHSLRAQAAAYDKSGEQAAMARYLAATPHLSMAEAFTVVRRYRRSRSIGG